MCSSDLSAFPKYKIRINLTADARSGRFWNKNCKHRLSYCAELPLSLGNRKMLSSRWDNGVQCQARSYFLCNSCSNDAGPKVCLFLMVDNKPSSPYSLCNTYRRKGNTIEGDLFFAPLLRLFPLPSHCPHHLLYLHPRSESGSLARLKVQHLLVVDRGEGHQSGCGMP